MKFTLFGLQAIWYPSANYCSNGTFIGTAVSTQLYVNCVRRLDNSHAGPHDQRPAVVSSVCSGKCLINMG